jgi:PPP family 3-phenylpropionic acid transporter
MACGSILSCITQPFLASRADRSERCILIPLIAGLSAISAGCFAMLLLPFLPSALFGVLYLLGVWSFDAMVPLLNSISVYYNDRGCSINYGLGRGVGSFAYSLAALGLGYVIKGLGPDWMIYAILVLLPSCIIITLGYPRFRDEVSCGCGRDTDLVEQIPCSVGVFFRRYRWYCLSLVGVLLLAMFHAMTENYLIAILGRLGGDSSHVGVALFIATVVEAPVLFFFNRIRTKINDHWLLRYAAFSFLLKAILFFVAPSIEFIYIIQLLQTTSYGFLSPVQVYYASEKVSQSDMVKGQAFITASYTLGCAMGNFTGGQLLEFFGVSAILLAGIVIAAMGTLVILLTVEKKDTPTPV